MEIPAGFSAKRVEIRAESEDAYRRLAEQHGADPRRNLGIIDGSDGPFTLGYFTYTVGECEVAVHSPRRPLKVVPADA